MEIMEPLAARQDRESMAPAITVVVAARDEEAYVADCVHSLLGQDAPAGGFEVLVAEGRSSDRTRQILDELATHDLRLRIVDNPEQITPTALNRAIRESRGRYIAIMSAHAHYPPDYLIRCLDVAESLHADNVGGPAIAQARSYTQRAIAASHHSPFSVGGATWHSLEYEGAAGTVFGGFYRRDVFDRIGMFDEELVRDQDDEFNFRLELAGGTIWQSPKIYSWYEPRSTLGGLFRQYLQYGYWKVLVMRKHGRAPALRHYVPAAFFLGLTLAAAGAIGAASISLRRPELGTLTLLFGAIFGIAVVSYFALLAIATVTTAARSGWRLAPILPVTFATYHVAYGLGFLRGLYDFALRRRRGAESMSRLTR
jgi:succinoglycan biosynthesis protein ExoA